MSNSLPPLPTKAGKIDEINAEDWGYKFFGRSIDNFIRDIEGEAALIANLDFRDRRAHAEDLMFNLVGLDPCLFYVRRKEQGQQPDEEKWELTIATDLDNVELPPILRERSKTLGLVAIVSQGGYGGLKVLSARLLPVNRGQADSFAVPCRLSLRSSHRYHIGVPSSAWARIVTMPLLSDSKPTEEQLQAWKVFENIEERLAKTRQFCVPFVNHNYGEATRNITFIIDANSATVDGTLESLIDVDDFWQRAKRARNQNLKALETIYSKGKSDGRELGTIESIEVESSRIRVRLDSEIFDLISEGLYRLPDTGFLSFEAAGDIVQIKRKKKALQDLEYGRTQNPYLSQFLFDASQARLPQEIITIQQQNLLLKTANYLQKSAVEIVLAAPDLALIQGPPGTGKTTVIAEICYQVALRGGRTLIASQANLAVDNALSRLEHNPVIRAVRKGKRGSVAPEGEQFLEDRVIGRWLQNTAADCEKNLSIHIDNVEILPQLLASSQKFEAYLNLEKTFEFNQRRLQEYENNLKSNKQIIENQHNLAKTKQTELEFLLSGLNDLLVSFPQINWTESKVSHLFVRLQPYINNHSAAQNLAANLHIVIEKMNLNPTEQNLFGKAAWVNNKVNNVLPEVKTALDEANNTVRKMREADAENQVLQQHHRDLLYLRQNYNNSFSIQNSQHKEIANLQNRISEIGLAVIELDRWTSNNQNLRQFLYKALQERQLLTKNSIELSPRLLALFAEIKSNPCEGDLQDFAEKFNNLIGIYRQWDQAYIIASKLDASISPLLKGLSTKTPSEEAVSKATKALALKGLTPLSALQKLRQLTHSCITELEKPLGFLAQIMEFILAVASQIKLCKPSRRTTAMATLEAVKRLAPIIIQKSQPSNIDTVINTFTDELVNTIVFNARTWLNQLQADTQYRMELLQEQFNNQRALVLNLEEQISRTEELIATASTNIDSQLHQVTLLWQRLSNLQYIPTRLRILIENSQHNPKASLVQLAEFAAQLDSWEHYINEIEQLIPSLNPFSVLENIKNEIAVEHTQQETNTKNLLEKLQESKQKLSNIDRQLQQQQENLQKERNWWEQYWQEIPKKFKPSIPSNELFNIIFLQNFQAQFPAWQHELENSQAYLQRYQILVSDWITKLHNPTEQDRKELQRIYLDNANVIGITCSQSASRDFSEEFKSFDVVIVDEVSKCTPPELLIPALKAKKLVLVGDHRQLPPMLDSDTLEEIAEELGSTREEISYLEESLFKSLFEQAPESIKVMLNTQYRMHPMIMGAINQFYDNQLKCGLENADKQRAHSFTDSIIQENKHIVWVKTPIQQGFKEQVDGTSFVNIKEVDAIAKLCEHFEQAWSTKIKQGQPRKEIGIITFYGRQLKLIEDRIDIRRYPSLHIRTGTVDRFQGMERQIIIVSMVRNNDQGKVGFAKKPERVNVAFSRAQELLVIVGCHSLFTQQHGSVGAIYSNVSNIVRINGGFIDVSDILC